MKSCGILLAHIAYALAGEASKPAQYKIETTEFIVQPTKRTVDTAGVPDELNPGLLDPLHAGLLPTNAITIFSNPKSNSEIPPGIDKLMTAEVTNRGESGGNNVSYQIVTKFLLDLFMKGKKVDPCKANADGTKGCPEGYMQVSAIIGKQKDSSSKGTKKSSHESSNESSERTTTSKQSKSSRDSSSESSTSSSNNNSRVSSVNRKRRSGLAEDADADTDKQQLSTNLI